MTQVQKAIISNRIYLVPENNLIKTTIEKKLTYTIEKQIGSIRGRPRKSIEHIKTYKHAINNIISIPQGRLDLIPVGYAIVDKRILVPVEFPEPSIPLRDEQLEVYNSVEDSCFINAKVGWGKTFCALHIAKKLGQKTLIVVHTSMLQQQWKKEVEKLFGFVPGSIGGDDKENLNSPIVVGIINTLTKNTSRLAKEFGTIILDEAHHCPATSFMFFIDAMYARYRIGLSGTMIRRDSLHVTFQDIFGHVVFKPKNTNTLDPTIRLIRTDFGLSTGHVWSRKINELLYDHNYQYFVAGIAATRVLKGHIVLIIADRTEFLTNIKELLGESCVLVTGDTSVEERDEIEAKIDSGEITSIAGARKIFSEGVSYNRLSSVILATPISGEGSSLEQIIGRIQRRHPLKNNPEVIDIQLSGPSDKKQNNSRLAFYMEKGWDIVAY